jgi:hypothetical protein
MVAIRLYIQNIIDEINTAGKQAKNDESQKRAFQRSEDEELPIKYQGGKDKGIFGPLMRTHGFE